jgi:hypothetical protein
MSEVDELYVLARRVLLDALDALGAHRDAMVLVGAQAVYLRVGEGDLAVAPFTTDGDLAIDPTLLEEIPPLEQALLGANFFPESKDSVGIWITKRRTRNHSEAEVAVDLLVPKSMSPGKGTRAARLQGHDSRAARMVQGLEAAIVDAETMKIASLEENDLRSFDMRVAGPASLLVAKVHKINDRQGSSRKSDKDALDVLRLLRGTETNELVSRYQKLLSDHRSAEAAKAGRTLLESLFGKRTGIGVEMAIRSAGVLADADEIAASCVALAGDFLGALKV